MYDLADVLPDAELSPGTNLLVAGPPLTGKRQIALDILASGSKQGEGTIVVTTKDSAQKIFDQYEGRVDDIDAVDIGIVDCVTKQRGVNNVTDDARIKYASSPVDMTGIGIKLSEFLEEFYEVRGHRKNRILLHSVSTLLMYSDLQTVFRFLHVFTGRVQSADALGVYIIDSTAHDDQTMNTLKQLFDAVIEVEENDDGEPTLHTAGIPSQ
ncbi:recombinase RecA [Haloarchaeobius sp. HME9146]|uniref:RAD55 family ATPase n=1 Tax=Haloarchaeobius sp. HME9146 TaxID=2978732 RepID=UPI0021C03B7F|nr:recombinase RecA [Haloarchaeobius sp. HME9146]MCT9096439.1 recombinase RecA [Haloarchaeobius sp. HME9146]